MMERQFTLKPHKRSRKNYSFKKTFGAQPVILVDEFLFLSEVKNQMLSGLNDCTACSTNSVRAAMKGKEYDELQYWQSTLQIMGVESSDGASLQDAFSVGVKTGFFPKGKPLPTDKASAYYEVEDLASDTFDDIRQAIQKVQAPIVGGLMWYHDWDRSPVIPYSFKFPLGLHAVKIAGWKQINGEPHLVIQNSWGTGYGDKGLYYFDRAISNYVFREGLFIFSDNPDADIKRMGLLSALLRNLKNLLTQLWIHQPSPPVAPLPIPPPVHVSKITDWANAIKKAEGWAAGSRSFLNHSPGNLKVSTYTMSLGASGTDKDNFCIFPNEQQGLNALCAFLTDAASNKLIPYHDATLESFTKIYAEPPGESYLNSICKDLGVERSIKISTLL